MFVLYIVLILGIVVVGVIGLFFTLKTLNKKEGILPNPLVVAPPEGSVHIALGNEDNIELVEAYIDRRIKEYTDGIK